MATFTLSNATKTAINVALQNNGNPGTNNQNFLTAYTDIYNDMVAYNSSNPGQIDIGVMHWFAQAGQVNQEGVAPNAPGGFLWNYTIAASAELGVTLSQSDMQKSSNAIAQAVFTQLSGNNYVFDTTIVTPKKVISKDAGTGMTLLGSLHNTTISWAAWGGSVFARTELDDPTYFGDNNLSLVPGSSDLQTIRAGIIGGVQSVAFESSLETIIGYFTKNNPFSKTLINSVIGLPGLDFGVVAAAFAEQSFIDDDVRFAQSLQGTSTGFAKFDIDFETAMGDALYTPTASSTLLTDWDTVAIDFDPYHLVQSNDSWSSIASTYNMSTAALEAINISFISNAGSVVAFDAFQPNQNFGVGAIIRIPEETLSDTLVDGNNLPAVSTIQGIASQQAIFFNINTNRWFITDELLDSSDGGYFEIVDENGETLASIKASTVTGVTPISLDGSSSFGGVQLTTSGGGTQTIDAPSFYDVQPGDGSLNAVASLLGIDPTMLASYNPAITDPTATLATGTMVELNAITDGQSNSELPGGNGTLTDYYGPNGVPTGSGSTTFDGSGNSVTMRYSGLNRTGASGGTTVTLQDGAGDYTTLGVLATNINFGATRVGADGGSSSSFDDQLLYLGGSDGGYPTGAQTVVATDASGPYTVESSYTGDSFGETYPYAVDALYPSAYFDVFENTGTSGQFSATIPLGLSSGFTSMQNGQSVSTTATTNVNFTLSGSVYATAVAQVSENGAALTNNAVTFTGHVGDQISQQFTLANIATGALTDSLSMALATQYASIFDITGLPRNVAAGGSANFTVTLNTSQAGNYGSGGAYIAFNSHDSQQADVQAVGTAPDFSATITNYAVGQVQLLSGTAALSGSGTSYVLNLGNITKGSTAQAVALSLVNAASNDNTCHQPQVAA